MQGKSEMKSDMFKQAPVDVSQGTKIPSKLVEKAFISHDATIELLNRFKFNLTDLVKFVENLPPQHIPAELAELKGIKELAQLGDIIQRTQEASRSYRGAVVE